MSSQLINEISSLRNRFEEMYEMEKEHGEFSSELRQIVRTIEEKQRELDKISGFSKVQIKSHDLVFSLETMEERHGKVASLTLENLLQRLTAILQTIAPGSSVEFEYQIVGVAPGSGSILADLETRQVGTELPDQTERKNSVKEKLKKVVSYGSKIGEKGDPTVILDEMMRETGLDEKKTYEVTKQLSGMYPRRDDPSPSVSIIVGSDAGISVAELPGEKRLSAERAKKAAHDRIKPEELTEITGTLGIVEAWEDKHKIMILDREGTAYTLYYENTPSTLRKIKANIGEVVTLNRMKDPTNRRRWIIESWVNAR